MVKDIKEILSKEVGNNPISYKLKNDDIFLLARKIFNKIGFENSLHLIRLGFEDEKAENENSNYNNEEFYYVLFMLYKRLGKHNAGKILYYIASFCDN